MDFVLDIAERESEAATPRRATASTRPIDRAHLARYTLGNVDLEQEVLGLFLAQLVASVDALRTASTERDWMVAAHTLKGASRGVGANRVALAAEVAERLSGASDPALAREAVRRVEMACREATSYILEAFPHLAARA